MCADVWQGYVPTSIDYHMTLCTGNNFIIVQCIIIISIALAVLCYKYTVLLYLSLNVVQIHFHGTCGLCKACQGGTLQYMAGVYARKTYKLQWRVLKSTESHNAGNIKYLQRFVAVGWTEQTT